jgi:NhaP-type Na+/H+ or K+/H+ antiporter
MTNFDINTLRTKANALIEARPIILVYIALAAILGMIIVNMAIDSHVLKALLTVGLIFLCFGCLFGYGARKIMDFLGKDQSPEDLFELPEDEMEDTRIVD